MHLRKMLSTRSRAKTSSWPHSVAHWRSASARSDGTDSPRLFPGRVRRVGMNRRLILQIKFGGLGDHLFFSHLPRIAKQSGECTGVYISNQSCFRSPEYKELIWKLNPFVDGFVDEPGKDVDAKPEIG